MIQELKAKLVQGRTMFLVLLVSSVALCGQDESFETELALAKSQSDQGNISEARESLMRALNNAIPCDPTIRLCAPPCLECESR